MGQQGTETTFIDGADLTASQALAQSRAANLVTRRRWPAVRSAVVAIQAARPAPSSAPPPPQARTA